MIFKNVRKCKTKSEDVFGFNTIKSFVKIFRILQKKHLWGLLCDLVFFAKINFAYFPSENENFC